MDITQQLEIRRDTVAIALFALTLFSSACLMFILQPMFGKTLLPLLGGSAAVWNTCMVFYQSILFLGYLYAHLLTTRCAYRHHLLIHISIIALSLYFLPVGIPTETKPTATDDPSLWLLMTLLSAIGLPFFVLSTNSPLLQKWFSKIGHATSHDPYYLSIASNSGSLIALLSYPLIIESSLGITQQQQYWSSGFLVLIALLCFCMLQLKQRYFQVPSRSAVLQTLSQSSDKPRLTTHAYWLLLAFVPSSLLLACTNFISIDIAAVPLMWVIPLALYLLSFILVFSKISAVIHKKILRLQPWIITPFLLYYFSDQKLASITLEMLLHLLVFFVSIMLCHGELAKKRPAPAYLTQYYLIMSFGGMLGGIFNTFVAPLLFSSIYEYPLMIIAALLLNPIHKRLKLYVKGHLARTIAYGYSLTFGLILLANVEQTHQALTLSFIGLSIMLAAWLYFKKHALYIPLVGLMVLSCTTPEKQQASQVLHQSRNFYGVLAVKELTREGLAPQSTTLHEIYSGTTKHGLQVVNDETRRCIPNGYYSPQGPLGSLFSHYQTVNNHWHIGVIGLGAGEMAAYAKPAQHWTFFELNPAVIQLATNPHYFTYLSTCIQNYQIISGDARISLEKQRQPYNLLVIDAFTSDAIPTHLLTREALELYFSHLQANGLLVFHISNHYLAFKKVLADHAQQLNLTLRLQEFRPAQKNPLVFKSDWAILARNPSDLSPLLTGNQASAWQSVAYDPTIGSWTDDFTSLMTVWK